MTRNSFYLYFLLCTIPVIIHLLFIEDIRAIHVALYYLIFSFPTFVLIQSERIGTLPLFFFDLITKILYVLVIDVSDLRWYRGINFWFIDTSWFWNVSNHLIWEWHNGQYFNFLDSSVKNGAVTSLVWAIFIKTFGANPTLIPLVNVIFLSASYVIMISTLKNLGFLTQHVNRWIGLIAISPISYFWILWGQKDVIVSFFLALTASMLTRLIFHRKVLLSLLTLLGISFVFWLERPYLSIFVLFACAFSFILPKSLTGKSRSRAWISSILGMFGCIAIVVTFENQLNYFLLSLIHMEISEPNSLAQGSDYFVKVMRLLVTPLPAKVDIESSVNILQSFGFLPNLFLQIHILFYIAKDLMIRPRVMTIVLPYIIFVAFWAVFFPGYNRIRDSFLPLTVIFIAVSSYFNQIAAARSNDELSSVNSEVAAP